MFWNCTFGCINLTSLWQKWSTMCNAAKLTVCSRKPQISQIFWINKGLLLLDCFSFLSLAYWTSAHHFVEIRYKWRNIFGGFAKDTFLWTEMSQLTCFHRQESKFCWISWLGNCCLFFFLLFILSLFRVNYFCSLTHTLSATSLQSIMWRNTFWHIQM